MPKFLYLFPDTNVFLQCKPLQQLNWSVLGDWDEIYLAISRPVQAEIDAFKGKGNNRQASRARRASALIRELLDATDNRIKLCNKPSVYLCLKHDLRRDETVSDILDYQERDDQLVGVALAFQKAHTDADVRLLTNDTGPMASARAVSLKFLDVPEDWLLPPETDEMEKRLKSLQDEVQRYKQAEPNFEIAILTEKKNNSTVSKYSVLSDSEVEELLERLTKSYPMATDFGARFPEERPIGGPYANYLGALGGIKEVYNPVSDEEIETYRDAYEQWKISCKEKLSNLANSLNSCIKWPTLEMRISNIGTRPAENSLVALEALGDIWIMAPMKNGEDRKSDSMSLHAPPKAPQGSWERIEMGVNFRKLTELMSGATYSPLRRNYKIPDLASIYQNERDPNAFYFKRGGDRAPSDVIEYSCDQWRHAHKPEEFIVSVGCELKPGKYSGCVRVTVHASNLTTPAVVNVPVHITVDEKNCLQFADQLIKNLHQHIDLTS